MDPCYWTKNLPVNGNTHVCKEHFMNASRRLLRPDEVLILGLLGSVKQNQPRKPPKNRTQLQKNQSQVDLWKSLRLFQSLQALHLTIENRYSDACVQTDNVHTIRESDSMGK